MFFDVPKCVCNISAKGGPTPVFRSSNLTAAFNEDSELRTYVRHFWASRFFLDRRTHLVAADYFFEHHPERVLCGGGGGIHGYRTFYFSFFFSLRGLA